MRMNSAVTSTAMLTPLMYRCQPTRLRLRMSGSFLSDLSPEYPQGGQAAEQHEEGGADRDGGAGPEREVLEQRVVGQHSQRRGRGAGTAAGHHVGQVEQAEGL